MISTLSPPRSAIGDPRGYLAVASIGIPPRIAVEALAADVALGGRGPGSARLRPGDRPDALTTEPGRRACQPRGNQIPDVGAHLDSGGRRPKGCRGAGRRRGLLVDRLPLPSAERRPGAIRCRSTRSPTRSPSRPGWWSSRSCSPAAVWSPMPRCSRRRSAPARHLLRLHAGGGRASGRRLLFNVTVCRLQVAVLAARGRLPHPQRAIRPAADAPAGRLIRHDVWQSVYRPTMHLAEDVRRLRRLARPGRPGSAPSSPSACSRASTSPSVDHCAGLGDELCDRLGIPQRRRRSSPGRLPTAPICAPSSTPASASRAAPGGCAPRSTCGTTPPTSPR